jgi:hypothetical protein
LPTWASANLIATETAFGAANVVPWPSAEAGIVTADGAVGAVNAVRLTIEVPPAEVGLEEVDATAARLAASRAFSRLCRTSSARRCSAGSRTVQPAESRPEPSGRAASRTTVGAALWPEPDVAAPSTAMVATEMAPTAVQRQIAHHPGNP